MLVDFDKSHVTTVVTWPYACVCSMLYTHELRCMCLYTWATYVYACVRERMNDPATVASWWRSAHRGLHQELSNCYLRPNDKVRVKWQRASVFSCVSALGLAKTEAWEDRVLPRSFLCSGMSLRSQTKISVELVECVCALPLLCLTTPHWQLGLGKMAPSVSFRNMAPKPLSFRCSEVGVSAN